jgi:hypothetical protein
MPLPNSNFRVRRRPLLADGSPGDISAPQATPPPGPGRGGYPTPTPSGGLDADLARALEQNRQAVQMTGKPPMQLMMKTTRVPAQPTQQLMMKTERIR